MSKNAWRGAGELLMALLLCICFFRMTEWGDYRSERAEEGVKNVILYIGDGMGPEQVRAAGLYEHGVAGSLFFETFAYQGSMVTNNVSGGLTDSAASGTAMATGVKVDNGVISVALPGDGAELKTMLEYFKEGGKSTGLVTTVPMYHATPAAFGAHEAKRASKDEIIDDYLTQSRPEVLLGGGKNGITPEEAWAADYVVVETALEMKGLDTESVERVSGQFAGEIPYEYDGVGDMPHLSEMTETALRILDNNRDGFFLMVEGGKIDWAAHDNDIARTVGETVEFDRAVEVGWDWARGRCDTLIVVTADHETGGLGLREIEGEVKLVEVSWQTGGHSVTEVPVYAWGAGADRFSGSFDNTDIFNKIMAAVFGEWVDE